MIDLHSHILNGVDDGARTLEDSLNIAKYAVEIGISHMMCTPHFHQGAYDNVLPDIEAKTTELAIALNEHNIPLKLAASGEIRIRPEVINLYSSGKLPTLGHWENQQVLLLELPHSHVPPGVENLVRWLLKHDVLPVIPHPERNRDIMNDYRKLLMLHKLGCKFQVTAGAFIGRFSDTSTQVAHRMLEEQRVFYIASDTHDLSRRPNDMLRAKEHIADAFSSDTADELTRTIPQRLTEKITWL